MTSRLVVAVVLGGAVGGVLRWSAGELVADGSGFPQTTFVVNVVGSFALALLPAIGVVRRSRVLTVAVGPGLLGGFTTLSAASVQTRALLDAGDLVVGVAYLVGTLVACLLAVALASGLSTPPEQRVVRDDGGDE